MELEHLNLGLEQVVAPQLQDIFEVQRNQIQDDPSTFQEILDQEDYKQQLRFLAFGAMQMIEPMNHQNSETIKSQLTDLSDQTLELASIIDNSELTSVSDVPRLTLYSQNMSEHGRDFASISYTLMELTSSTQSLSESELETVSDIMGEIETSLQTISSALQLSGSQSNGAFNGLAQSLGISPEVASNPTALLSHFQNSMLNTMINIGNDTSDGNSTDIGGMFPAQSIGNPAFGNSSTSQQSSINQAMMMQIQSTGRITAP